MLRQAGASFEPNDPLMAELAERPVFESAAEEPLFQEVLLQLTDDLRQPARPWEGHADVYEFADVAVAPAQWDELHEQTLRRGFYLVHSTHSLFGGLATVLLFPTSDKYAVINACGTDGGTCDLSTRQIVAWLRKLDKKLPFVLMGCGHDFLTGRFLNPVRNALQLASSIEQFCPDVVQQGCGTVNRLAYELARTQRFVLWWD